LVLMIVLAVFGVLGVCAVIGVGWIALTTFGEFSVYEKAEKSCNAALNEFEADQEELQRDGDAYIVANKAKLRAARAAVSAARESVGSIAESEDRSDYLTTLRDVEKSLQVLEALATEKGAAGLAIEIEQAESPARTAAESSDECMKAYRAKRYAEMYAAAQSTASEATKAASALSRLDEAHPGLGIADLRDEAALTCEFGLRMSELARAYQAHDKATIDSVSVKLDVIESKYEGAADRAVRSVAYAVWVNPGSAVKDALRRLDKAKAAHAAVYQRIDEGE
jgi:hypothetical protein